jgi:3-oxoacyl-[acyl-carrier protein] reductase
VSATRPHALVTGGSLGIGYAVAAALAGDGWRVTIAARSLDAVSSAVAALPGDEHAGLRLDIADPDAWPAAIAELRDGGLDGVVCAAGILGPIGPLAEIDPLAAIATIEVNLVGTLLTLHHTLPLLQAAGGRAVTFSGGGGTAPLTRYDAYAASKAGVVRLTENVAADGAVEINSVAPGFVVTRMHEQTLAAGPDAAGPEYHERTRTQIAAGGFPAGEAAELVSFLLSPDAQGITGKLLSAQWDPWRDPAFRQRLRTERELATLRRIDDVFFAPVAQ